MRILITGVAGFIGFHLANRLLNLGHEVFGIDNLNDYYSPQLKQDRLAQILPYTNFSFKHCDLADQSAIESVFSEKFSHVVNLAGQAGVRYSLKNPSSYIQANLVGFGNLLECCRHHPPEHLVYASSSSVYGLNRNLPFSTQQNTDHPASLYAATKKANELMAHSYSHLYGLSCTGLRFFTVYGPWGRPDMAPDIFAHALLHNQPIEVFNNGEMLRDFTYIDDIVEGILRIMQKPAKPDLHWDALNPDSSSSSAPWRLYNIGNDQPIPLLHFIATLEKSLGKSAILQFLPMQVGDVKATWAQIDSLVNEIAFTPSTRLETGIQHFVEWYKDYYDSES